MNSQMIYSNIAGCQARLLTMRKILVTICLAFVVPDMDNVMMARMTKFEPPQKSVSLSNFKVKAMEKPMS